MLQLIYSFCLHNKAILYKKLQLIYDFCHTKKLALWIHEQSCLFEFINFVTTNPWIFLHSQTNPWILLHNQTTFLDQSSQLWINWLIKRVVHFWLNFWHNLSFWKAIVVLHKLIFSTLTQTGTPWTEQNKQHLEFDWNLSFVIHSIWKFLVRDFEN